MSKALDQIRTSAMELPVEDRAVLSAELAASVAPEMTPERSTEIDQVLLKRMEGPFVSIDPHDDGFWQGLQDEALRRIAARRHA